MERDITGQPEGLLEFGTASADTQGGLGQIIEPMGLWHKAGITDE